MYNPYLTLPEYCSVINSKHSTLDADTRLILIGELEEVGAEFELETRRKFYHRYATIPHAARYMRYGNGGTVSDDRRTLWLNDTLLSAVEVYNAGVETALASSDYALYPVGGRFATNLRAVNFSWNIYTSEEKHINVYGLWGFSGEWVNKGVKLSAAIDSDDAVITVTPSNGLQDQQLIRVGSEFMLVEVSGGVITVRRAYNGSTAASHSENAVVYTFSVDPVVRRGIKRLAAWRHEQKKSPLMDVKQVGDLSVSVNTTKMPADLLGIIRDLKKPANVG